MELRRINDIADSAPFASWLTVDKRGIHLKGPQGQYAGTYSDGGIVASNMAEFIRTELVATPIETAWLYITMPHPEEPARRALFFILGIAESEFVFCETVMEFGPADMLRLETTLAWLLACGSEFTLMVPTNHLLVVNKSDRRLKLSWDASAQMHPKIAETMRALEFIRQS